MTPVSNVIPVLAARGARRRAVTLLCGSAAAGTWLLGVAGCAGSAGKPAATPAALAAPAAPAAATTTTGTTGAATPALAGGSVAAPAPAAAAPASSPPSPAAAGASPAASAAAPPAVSTAPGAPAAAPANTPATSAVSTAAGAENGVLAVTSPTGPATPVAQAPVAQAPVAQAPVAQPPIAQAAAPATSPVTPAPAAPLAPTAPRVLIADELPSSAAHLHAHAHEAKAEHHHHHDAGRDSEEAEGRGSKRPYHPAPGIVVDVVDAAGGASASDLQRVARNLGYWPFRQCYEDGLRRDQRIAGKVSLELVVSPSGAVDRSVVTAATVRDEIVAACVAREAQRLALPGGGAPTTAKVDVTLAVGDEPVPAARPVPNAEPLRDALRGSWGAVRQCYASGVASRPGIGGRMELRFRLRHGEIADVAEVTGAGDSGARFGDSEVTRCVVGVYRTAHLPALKSTHGREHAFAYALEFESIPGDTATR